ncbi:MAG: HK97 gp10 family phage protein [Gorillibacterium sp.]|nr:HK97 gp10 family phage protein [Gorillibacterium sp.]
MAGMKNLDRLIRKLDSLGGNVQHELRIGTLQATKLVQGDAKDLASTDQGRLRNSIQAEVKELDAETIQGRISTNVEHAAYVEFGTGPVGQANNGDLPPDIRSKITYKQDGWWIHESQIDAATAEKYHFFKIETDSGVFYYTRGMPAKPFMYPAIKGRRKDVPKIIALRLKQAIHKLGGGR